MASALRLARRGLGRTWPNPAVGCVLVNDSLVVGRGWTAPGGRPHAETEALRRAAGQARGGVAYVTLEPCAHHGQTPPCADALIAAGVSRAVVAIEDPDPRVAGKGLAKMREAGVAVTLGVGAEAAAELNAGFLMRINQGRPFVTLKMATSLDGRIATHGGDSQWITGEEARARAHLMRAEHDTILVGSGTALADDPALTVRLPGLDQSSPVRVVLDGRLRTPLTHDVVRTADITPSWLVTVAGGGAGTRRAAFERAGVEVMDVDGDEARRPAPAAVLEALAARGITRLLIEGGGTVAASFLRAGLVDRLCWFRAGLVIGGDGIPATAPFGVDALVDAPRFRHRESVTLGEDVLDVLDRAS